MRSLACSLVVALALPPVLSAAETTPADRAGSLAPLTGEETLAVVRLDATKLDADALFRQLKAAAPEAESWFGDRGDALKKWLAAFTAAGGTELVAVFSTPELPRVSLVHVALKEGADEAALKRLLQDVSAGAWRVEGKGRALVAGEPAALARFARGQPSARPELAAALEAAGDGGLQALLLPTDDQRRVVEEVMPLLRKFAGIPARALVRGVRWAALGLDAAPTPSLRLTVRSADAAAAERTAALARTGLAALGRQVFWGEEKPLEEVLPAEYKAAAEALKPAVRGDRLTATLSGMDQLKDVATVAAFVAERFEPWPASANNLKDIMLAMHNYAASHKTLPPTAIRSKDGKPLLSWRVAILPYLKQEALYRQFHLDEPWDSEHNRKLIDKLPAIYRSSRIRDRRPGLTTYLVPVGKEVAFTGGPTGRSLRDEFTDGTSNTILLLDVADDKGVIWTRPEDLAVDLNDPKKGLVGHYPAFFMVGLADGSVTTMPKTVSNATLRAAFTVAGGEVPGPW